MNATVITGQDNVYDFMWRLFNAIRKKGAARATDNSMMFHPTPGSKTLRTYAVDTISYPGFGKRLIKGVTHQHNGSLVTFWYKAMHKATAEQIAKAKRAVIDQKLPRDRYTGRLIDIFDHKGSKYVLLMDVQERDIDGNFHHTNFRMLNIDEGELRAIRIDEVSKRRRKPVVVTV